MVGLLAVSGCSHPAPTAAPVNGDCPATITVQSWWTPQAENASLYQSLLPAPGKPATYTVNAKGARISGPLYDDGHPTGLSIEIRAGGPSLNYASTPSLMALDHSILIGQVSTLEDQIAAYGRGGPLDTVMVMAPLATDPRAIMWDRDRHPEIHSLADVGKSGIPLYTVLGATSTEHLVATGVLTAKQPDSSGGGNSTDRFMTNRNAATTGYVTNELEFYRSKGVDVDFDMIDIAFPTYSDPLVVRRKVLTENAADAACLRRVVPILQRNERAFVAAPDRAVTLVSQLAKQYRGEDYPVRRGLAGIATAKNLGIIANGPKGVLGATDSGRIADVLNDVRSVLATKVPPVTLPADLSADRLATDEFLDPTVSLSAS